jgi:hypothetical protein
MNSLWPAYINILITSDDQARRVNCLSKEFEREREPDLTTREGVAKLFRRTEELLKLIHRYNELQTEGTAGPTPFSASANEEPDAEKRHRIGGFY